VPTMTPEYQRERRARLRATRMPEPPVVAPMPTPAPIARPGRSMGAVALSPREPAALYAACRRGAAPLASVAGSTGTADARTTGRLGALADPLLATSVTGHRFGWSVTAPRTANPDE
jgi:hypothetical protein